MDMSFLAQFVAKEHTHMSDTETLLTGKEWSDCDPEYEVIDPDGWDRSYKEGGVYFTETRITHTDYLKRCGPSTLRMRRPDELTASK